MTHFNSTFPTLPYSSAIHGPGAGRALPDGRNRKRDPDFWTNCGMLLIGAVGLSLTSYLSWASLTASQLAGCGGGKVFDCSHVMQSKWSSIFGLPVGVPAAMLYLALLVATVVRLYSHNARVRVVSVLVMTFCAVTAAIAAVWFISLQLFVVKHLCGYCLAAHSCGLATAALVLWQMPLERRWTGLISLVSLISVGLVAIGQTIADEPQTFQVVNYGLPAATANDNSERPVEETVFPAPSVDRSNVKEATSNSVKSPRGETEIFEAPVAEDQVKVDLDPAFTRPFSGDLPLMLLSVMSGYSAMLPDDTTASDRSAAGNGEVHARADDTESSRRLVQVAGGQIQLVAEDWPLVGSQDAPLIFVEMFDYTCPYCRANHKSVKAALEAMQGQVAFIALSVPLNAQCNPTVQTTGAEHAEACELARLSVAVWRADASRFEQFHNWLFDSDVTPTAAQARQQAASLVGKEELEKALGEKIVGQYVARQVELYKNLGAGPVPKMLFPGRTISGTVDSTDKLLQIIRQEADASSRALSSEDLSR